MNINRYLFYFFLFVVLLLLIGLAYLIRPARQIEPAISSAAGQPAALSQEPVLNSDDFTIMLDHPATDIPSARDILPASAGQTGLRPSFGREAISYTPSVPGRMSVKAPAHSSVPSVRKTVFPAVKNKAVVPVVNNTPRVSNRSFTNRSGVDVPSASRGNAAFDAEANQKSAEARENIYSSLPPLAQKEQKALNRRLQGFSAGLERAIARAVLPSGKSKREQNIEKYLARARGEAPSMDNEVYGVESRQAGGAVQEVMQQLASQSKNIVNDMRSSYGDSAASEAQSIMNDFQKEMGETLNAPGDPQEKQIRAQAVNNKYNNKLQQLNQKESLSKMEAQMRAENEEYLKKISEGFGPEAAAAARPKLEENMLQKLNVYATPQSEEEVAAKLIALEEQKQKDLEEIVRTASQGKGWGDLTSMKNDLTEPEIRKRAQAVREGKMPVQPYWEGDTSREKYRQAWADEANALVQQMSQLSPEYAAQAQAILQEQQRARNEIRDQAIAEGTDINIMLEADLNKTKETNQKLQQLGILAKEDYYNKANDQRIEAYTQHMQGISDDVKEKWAQKARPIMEKYNKQRAAVEAQVKSREEYEQKMKEFDQQEFQELQQIQIAVPANNPQ